jgi:hypothetical protein
MKNGVFWDVTPCGSCKDRRFDPEDRTGKILRNVGSNKTHRGHIPKETFFIVTAGENSNLI